MLGIPSEEIAIDWNQVVFNMLTVKGIYGREMYETWYMMSVMLQSGLDITPVITHRFHYTEYEEAFEAAIGRARRQGPARLGAEAMLGRRRASSWRGGTGRDPRRRPVQVRAADRLAAARRRSRSRGGRGDQPLRQQLPRPGRPSRGGRGRPRGARPLGLRDGLGPLHLRHPGDPRRAGASGSPSSSAPRRRSSTAPASTPTAASSRPCSAPRTRSSPTPSTTPRSSTASASARRAGCATRNSDMDELEARLVEAAGARRRLVVTDGVFSMDGYLARLDRICDLAERHDAMVMVDDSHAVGFVGATGRGTPELFGVIDRVDIVTGTLGKALGGASGGYVSGRGRDRRPAAPALPSLPLLQRPGAADRRRLAAGARPARSAARRRSTRLRANTETFRREIAALGYEVLPGDHPIVPVMFGDADPRRARSPSASSPRASTWSPSPTPWCRWAPPGSAPRCRRPTTRPTCAARSRPSPPSAEPGLLPPVRGRSPAGSGKERSSARSPLFRHSPPVPGPHRSPARGEIAEWSAMRPKV